MRVCIQPFLLLLERQLTAGESKREWNQREEGAPRLGEAMRGADLQGSG